MELKTYFAQDAAGNIISSAIVNVFLQGTTTLATGLTRADGTPLENPFAADGAGRIQFRAPDGYYDVQVSAGPGIIQTLTIQCVDYSEAKSAAEQAQNALNSITGINTNFEQNSREQWRRSLAEAGLTLVSGSFEEGATVTKATDAVWHIAGGQCYTWDSTFPMDVPAKSTPSSAGGIATGAWVSVLDGSLRSQLYSESGSFIIRVAGGQTLQAAINMAKPFVRSGTFANGGEISTEYDTFYSHTDEHGNDYWWSYIGSSTFPVTVPANSTPDSNWMLVISDDFTAPLSPEIEIAGVSSLTSASVTYSVSDTSSFIVGKYAFISSTVRDGQWYCGIFKVLSKTSTTVELQQSNAKITASGTTLLGSCKIRAMNFIVNSPGGVTANGFVRRVEGVLFDGKGTASYGLMLGGGHNNTGVMRNSASIGSLRQCAFVNLRRSGATSDDVVGILVAAGSSLGVRNVAVNGTKIGIETYRNGSLIGMGAYVYDASNDAFKAEFTCNNYLYYCAAIKCGTGFSARYNAGGEYATIVCCNAVYGAIAQFEGYCSVRSFSFYGMTSAGVYSTDGGYMLVAGTSEIDTCNRSYRCIQGATIEQIANTIITERNCAGGYNVNSASLRLLVRTVVSGGSDTWDGEGEVIINGVDQSLAAYTASTTIPANARAAWQVIFPFTFDESGARKVKFGIRYSDSTLPAGVIVPFPAYYNSSSCRIYFYNLTAVPIVLNASVYAYVTS